MNLTFNVSSLLRTHQTVSAPTLTGTLHLGSATDVRIALCNLQTIKDEGVGLYLASDLTSESDAWFRIEKEAKSTDKTAHITLSGDNSGFQGEFKFYSKAPDSPVWLLVSEDRAGGPWAPRFGTNCKCGGFGLTGAARDVSVRAVFVTTTTDARIRSDVDARLRTPLFYMQSDVRKQGPGVLAVRADAWNHFAGVTLTVAEGGLAVDVTVKTDLAQPRWLVGTYEIATGAASIDGWTLALPSDEIAGALSLADGVVTLTVTRAAGLVRQTTDHLTTRNLQSLQGTQPDYGLNWKDTNTWENCKAPDENHAYVTARPFASVYGLASTANVFPGTSLTVENGGSPARRCGCWRRASSARRPRASSRSRGRAVSSRGTAA